MKLKRFRIIICLIFLVLAMVVPGVYGNWSYYIDSPVVDEANRGIILGGFYYNSQEILPDSSEDIKNKENHYLLIENILNHNKYGLNRNDKEVIHNYLGEDGNILYGQQNVSGGNLKHVLVKNTSAENVQFVITRISATEYHAYTYKVADLNGTAMGSYLEAYKTILVYGEHEDGEAEWHLHGSLHGYAKAFAPKVVSKSVDITTFTTVKPTSVT